MTTEDGDVDPAGQYSSNQRFCSGETSGAGEPEPPQDIKNLQEAVFLPLTYFFQSSSPLTSQPLLIFKNLK